MIFEQLPQNQIQGDAELQNYAARVIIIVIIIIIISSSSSSSSGGGSGSRGSSSSTSIVLLLVNNAMTHDIGVLFLSIEVLSSLVSLISKLCSGECARMS